LIGQISPARAGVALAVFAAGIGPRGLWTAHSAVRGVEADLTGRAEAAIPVQGAGGATDIGFRAPGARSAQGRLSGRDLTLTGRFDGPEEQRTPSDAMAGQVNRAMLLDPQPPHQPSIEAGVSPATTSPRKDVS
jgi:hypothetical protein